MDANLAPLNLAPLDYVILIVVFISTAIALARGFTREVLSITSWILAGLGTLIALPLLRPFAQPYIAPSWLADMVVGAVVFVVIMLIFSFLAKGIASRLQESVIGFVDRLLGGVFGLARGCVIVIFAYFVMLLLVPAPEHPNWIQQARLLPSLKVGTAMIIKLIPLDNISQNLPDIDNLFNQTTGEKIETF